MFHLGNRFSVVVFALVVGSMPVRSQPAVERLPAPKEAMIAPSPEQYEQELQAIRQERLKTAKAIFARALVADVDDAVFMADANELRSIEMTLAKTPQDKVTVQRNHVRRIEERIAIVKKATGNFQPQVVPDPFFGQRLVAPPHPQHPLARMGREDHLDRLNLHRLKAKEELLELLTKLK